LCFAFTVARINVNNLFSNIFRSVMVVAEVVVLSGMDTAQLLLAVKTELMRHCWEQFVHEPIPQVRVILLGCPFCKKPFGTIGTYMNHLADAVRARLTEEKSCFQAAASYPPF
jgi:hypothetical protein